MEVPIEKGILLLLNNALAEIKAAGVETSLLQVAEGIYDAKPFCLCCTCDRRCKNTRLAEMFDLLRRADGILLGGPCISAQFQPSSSRFG